MIIEEAKLDDIEQGGRDAGWAGGEVGAGLGVGGFVEVGVRACE